MAEFFANHITEVFFFYGLAFFLMGLAVFLEVSHSSHSDFANALIPLAGFGLIHGSHEWFEMWLINHALLTGDAEPQWVYYLRIGLLGISFMFLIIFGVRILFGRGKPRLNILMIAVIAMIWGIGLVAILSNPTPNRSQLIAADVYTRYSLAIPGAALAACGLIFQSKRFKEAGMRSFGIDALIAACAFALYGGIGQLFASPSSLFPSSYFNSGLFLSWFGFPIQGFRALMAIISAIFIIRSLRSFDEENRRQIQALNEAQKAEQQHRQELRASLLRRTVQAQEKERQRIARELHDETGQTLTALGLGLNGLAQTISADPQRSIRQAKQLQELATNGLIELQRLVSGLHPPQLDELGLVPALRWYTGEIQKRFDIDIKVISSTNEKELPEEIKLTIFRIAQEAITNAIRHAQASKVLVTVNTSVSKIELKIEDNGQGFDVEEMLHCSDLNCLGLLGMIERAKLVGGSCTIRSQPGQGSIVEVIFERATENHNSLAAG